MKQTSSIASCDTFEPRCYFLEEGAVDLQGRLLREKQKAVNKIGHGKNMDSFYVPELIWLCESTALHELDPVFRNVTMENERIRAVVRDLKFHRDPVGKIYDSWGEFCLYNISISTPINANIQTTSNWRRRFVFYSNKKI